jgi:hypothetical protein
LLRQSTGWVRPTTIAADAKAVLGRAIDVDYIRNHRNGH